jgi:hypothetical protein
MLLTELIPGEVQGLVETSVVDLGEAFGLGGRAVAGNQAEGLSSPDQSPQIERGDRIGGGSLIHVISLRPLGPKRISQVVLFTGKDFLRNDRLGPSGNGGKPIKAGINQHVVRPPCVFMVAHG